MSNLENQQANNAGTNTAAAGDNDKMFTQEDVNRIVQERLSREKGKPSFMMQKDLEEREKALAAKEQAIAFKEILKTKNIPEEVYDALNCTSEDTFNKSLEILGPYFQKLNEPIVNAVGATGGNVAKDAIRVAMGLK